MATATAPVPTARTMRRDVTAIVDLDNGRRHDFTWTLSGGVNALGGPIADFTGEGMAFERVPVATDVLEDRWDGLLSDDHGDFTKLNLRLDRVLQDLASGVVRFPMDAEQESYLIVDGEIIGVQETMDLEGLRSAIHEWIINRAQVVASR